MSGAWIFQGNPAYHDTSAAVHALTETTWLVRQYTHNIEVGDPVYLWETGANAGIVARCVVVEAPRDRTSIPGEDRFYVEPSRFEGEQYRALLSVVRIIDPRLTREECLSDSVLST